jgi:outer membrane protein TolC
MPKASMWSLAAVCVASVAIVTKQARGQVAPGSLTQEPAPGLEAPLTPETPAGRAPPPRTPDLLRAFPNGLTGDAVARRSLVTSFTVKQYAETLRASAARVDQAFQAFLPRLRVSGSLYSVGISNPPSLGTVVVDSAAPGPIGLTDVAQGKLKAVPLALPTVLGAYLLEATVTVPVSDYFLRLCHQYESATSERDAARYDLESQKASSTANARVAYYTWLRSRGAVAVSVLALEDQKTHLALAENQLKFGRASRADVLRAETGVASAELALEQAKNLADVSEKQLRVAIHAEDDEELVPGESLDTALVPVQGLERALEDEAIARRPEIKAFAARARSLRKQATAARNAGLPTLSASGNAIAANANEGALGPTSNWIGVYYFSAQLSWSPNDVGVQASAAADALHRAGALEAQALALQDSIQVEVKQDFLSVRQADVSISTAERELASAEEGYRVARALFDNGRSLSTQLTDAETDLTRARLDLLNARANARIARVELEHALGRDLK